MQTNKNLKKTHFSMEMHVNHCHYDANLGIDYCSLTDNLRIHEISDEQIQQLSASINPGMLEGNDCIAQKKERVADVMWYDAIHQSKEMSPLHLQLYNDITWDPMLLECQLNHIKENQIFTNDCHTFENKEVGTTWGRDLVPSRAGIEAFEKVVLQTDSESHKKIGIKAYDVESQRAPEAPIIAANLAQDMEDQEVHRKTFPQIINSQFYVQLSEISFSLRNRKENSWHEAEATIEATCISEPAQKVPPTVHPAESIILADQELEPEGSSLQEYETKRDEVQVIQMEHGTGQFDFNSRDDKMEDFYAALHAETYTPSPLALGGTRDDLKLAYPKMSEEAKKALEILKNFLSKQFCQILDPASSTSMKTTLAYLCSLFADDDISLSLKSLMLQLSADFNQWSWDYIDASIKLKSSTAGLSNLDMLEEGLIANKNQFREFVSIENELCSQLAYLEERMKELQEQINGIKANISISALARDTALRKKRETFEEARMLKSQRDELRKQRPRMRAEQESAIATKANIEDEWSKIREKFDRILNIFYSYY